MSCFINRVQASNGGAAFYAGKSINNKEPKEQASIAGAVAMALHVRQMAKFYGIPVVLHSDHCAKKLLPWFDGMLEADEVGNFLLVWCVRLYVFVSSDSDRISLIRFVIKHLELRYSVTIPVGYCPGGYRRVDSLEAREDG